MRRPLSADLSAEVVAKVEAVAKLEKPFKRTIRMPRVFGIFLSLLLLCACATGYSAPLRLPPDVTMNPEAGRGSWLIVTVRLEDGEALPFVVDTGVSDILIDKSLAPKLGKRLGTVAMNFWGTNTISDVYPAPGLYLNGTPLMMTVSNIITFDLKEQTCDGEHHPGMGVLGMNVLEHYCIQLDFTAGKMRFLDDEQANKQEWGKAFPLAAASRKDPRPSISGNLIGAKDTRSMIDTGCNIAGWLTPESFLEWINRAMPPADGEARSPNGVLAGETYHRVSLCEKDIGVDGIGLDFLSRHMVTLDFPKRTLYLKRTSDRSLIYPEMDGANKFLGKLKKEGRLPGFSKNDQLTSEGPTFYVHYPSSVTWSGMKRGDSSIYHYTVSRASIYGPWKLQKAWRTDQDGHTVEEYPVP